MHGREKTHRRQSNGAIACTQWLKTPEDGSKRKDESTVAQQNNGCEREINSRFVK